MKQTIKIIFIYLTRCLLRLLFIFPINNKKICFISFGGRAITCNPKYIYLYMQKNNKDFKFIWLSKKRNKSENLENNTKIVKYISLSAFFHLATSKYIITNYSMIIRPPIRKKQIYVNTWHGGGAYKKVGLVKNTIEQKRTDITFNLLAKETTYLISSCKIQSEVQKNTMRLNNEQILNIGFPRNDIFFTDFSHYSNIIKKYYNIPEKTKILLYAPTYRGVSGNFSENASLDIQKVLFTLKNKFNSDFICLYRGHYYIHDQKLDNTINASDYPDMQELLCAADVLITDYSSSIWDFSFTKKPCFLYTPDLEQYKNERDFYTDISKWGFTYSKNTLELIKNIESFDQNEYNKKIEEAHKFFGSYEDGKASERFIEKIFKI